jgi:hypothetical protein
MEQNSLQSPRHQTVKQVLRIGGPILLLAGLLFLLIGMVSFFLALGSFGAPRYFWCSFVGIPLVFVGSVMCKFGYLGEFVRYVSAESAPVAKDTINYLGQETQPGVKAVAKAITEGLLEAQREDRPNS